MIESRLDTAETGDRVEAALQAAVAAVVTEPGGGQGPGGGAGRAPAPATSHTDDAALVCGEDDLSRGRRGLGF